MKRNIQHSTFNIQRPTARLGSLRLGCWALNVECSMLLLLAFFAQSVFSQTTNPLPPLTPSYPEIPPTFWELHGMAILAGSVTLIALAAVVLWKLLQPKPVIVLPPEIVAREALVQLQRRPEDGTLLSEISQILRRYVVAVFDLPAAELTTAELCAALAGCGKINAELAGAIAAFLRECDERKFAPPGSVGVQASACPESRPAAPDMEKRELQPAAARALELVELAEKRLAMVGRASSRAETDGSSVASPHRNAATK